MNRAENKAARKAAQEEAYAYAAWLASLNDDELDNEDYTLKYERRFLTALSDDQVGDRLVLIEGEKARRQVGRCA